MTDKTKPESRKPSLELDLFLPYSLMNLSKRLSSVLATIYQNEYDLTIPEWRVIANLNQAGALTSKEIALQTYMDKVKVCRAIKSLTNKSWIKKKRHAIDSRAYLVSLSGEGQKVIDSLIPKVLSWQATLVESLGTREFQSLQSAIAKLNKRLDESGSLAQFTDKVDNQFDS